MKEKRGFKEYLYIGLFLVIAIGALHGKVAYADTVDSSEIFPLSTAGTDGLLTLPASGIDVIVPEVMGNIEIPGILEPTETTEIPEVMIPKQERIKGEKGEIKNENKSLSVITSIWDDVPRTGDVFPLRFYGMIVLASCIMLTILFIRIGLSIFHDDLKAT